MKITNKMLWCAIGALTVLCISEAYYIYDLKQAYSAPATPPALNYKEESLPAAKYLYKGAPAPIGALFNIFENKFFGHRFSPFAGRDDFLNHFDSPHKEGSQMGSSLFESFGAEFGFNEINPQVSRTGNQVIVSIKVPGLKGESFDINFDSDRIKISYKAETSQDKTNDKLGLSYKSASIKRFENVIPIPAGADPETGQVALEGDTIKITFDKRHGN